MTGTQEGEKAQKLTDALLNEPWAIEEICEENLKESENRMKNKSSTRQNLWNLTKAVTRGASIASSSRTVRLHRNNSRMNLKTSGRQGQSKPQSSRWKEITKSRGNK